MKVKMLTEFYSNGKIVLKGKNKVFEVEDNLGKYLVNTFPNWFQKIGETKEEPKKPGRRKTKIETK